MTRFHKLSDFLVVQSTKIIIKRKFHTHIFLANQLFEKCSSHFISCDTPFTRTKANLEQASLEVSGNLLFHDCNSS